MENVSETSIRVAVVDDHIMVSELLALSISKENDLSLVGVVGGVDDALELIDREHPDVILLNYRRPDFECIEVVKLMMKESPTSRVVMLSANGDHDLQRLAINAGCTGLLGKNARIAEVLGAIRAAARGELVLSSGDSYQLRSA
jgi:DNA-binding NarL/FixJ family response regulator